MVSPVKLNLEEEVLVAQSLETDTVVLICSDNVRFTVPRDRLTVNSKLFLTILRHIPREKGTNGNISTPLLTIPCSSQSFALILPYLRNTDLPKIVSLTDDGIWGAIRFALKYDIDLAIEAYIKACRRYASKTSTLEQKILAFLVSFSLGPHSLKNLCLKMVLHHNAPLTIFDMAVERLKANGKLSECHESDVSLKILRHCCHLRIGVRTKIQSALYQKLKDAQVEHHGLPIKIKCNCQREKFIEQIWSYACQAKQHDLKRFVAAYGGTEMCNESARKVFHALWSLTEPTHMACL